MDWTLIGTNAGMLVAGVIAYFTGKGQRSVGDAQTQAQVSEYRADSTLNDAQASQIKALLDRVELLESKYTKLWDDLQTEKTMTAKSRDRIRLLESILRENSIEVPPEAP